MIGFLRGTCQHVGDDHVVLDVAGVGYEVFVTERLRGAAALGVALEVRVHTEVREDAIILFGFEHAAEKTLFRLLLSVSGVGPRGALALLGALPPGELAVAVRDGKVAALTKAKGIGKKTAETIIIKLRDRLPADLLWTSGPTPPGLTSVLPPGTRDVLSALQNLGYRPALAEHALAEAHKAHPEADFDGLLRSALAMLRRPG